MDTEIKTFDAAQNSDSLYVKFCCVPSCYNYSGKGFTFHGFPKDESLRKQWENVLKLDKPATASMQVCSEHFTKHDYFSGSADNKYLQNSSVPSQKLPIGSVTKQKIKRLIIIKRCKSSVSPSSLEQPVQDIPVLPKKQLLPPPYDSIHYYISSPHIDKKEPIIYEDHESIVKESTDVLMEENLDSQQLKEKAVLKTDTVDDSGIPMVKSEPGDIDSGIPMAQSEPSCIPMVKSGLSGIDSGIPMVESVLSDINSGIPMVQSEPSGIDSGIPMVKSEPSDIDSGIPMVKSEPSDIDRGIPMDQSEPSGIDSGIPMVKSEPSDIDSGIPMVKSEPSDIDRDIPMDQSEPSGIDSGNPMVKSEPTDIDSGDPMVKSQSSDIDSGIPVVKSEPIDIECTSTSDNEDIDGLNKDIATDAGILVEVPINFQPNEPGIKAGTKCAELLSSQQIIIDMNIKQEPIDTEILVEKHIEPNNAEIKAGDKRKLVLLPINLVKDAAGAVQAKVVRRNLKSAEKQVLINIYNHLRECSPNWNKDKRYEKTAELGEVSVAIVQNCLQEYTHNQAKASLDTSEPHDLNQRIENLTHTQYSCIRRTVHSFFYRKIFPTVKMIVDHHNASRDPSLPILCEKSVRRVLMKLGFKCGKVVSEKQSVGLARRSYLDDITRLRNDGKKIFYLDEMILGNESSANISKGKENTAVVAIGNKDGFLETSLLVTRTKDSDCDEMSTELFEKWFAGAIRKVPRNSFIVMDSAAHHCRKEYTIPTENSLKTEIKSWLEGRDIYCPEKASKSQLLEIIKTFTGTINYAIDSMAEKKNIEILRIPLYYSELNPMEAIFCHMDQDKFISPAVWMNCIKAVVKEERKMLQLDDIIDSVQDKAIVIERNHIETSCSDEE